MQPMSEFIPFVEVKENGIIQSVATEKPSSEREGNLCSTGANILISHEKKISSACKCHVPLFIIPGPKVFQSLKTEGLSKDPVQTDRYSQKVSKNLVRMCYAFYVRGRKRE